MKIILNQKRKGWCSESGCTGLEIGGLLATLAGTEVQEYAGAQEQSKMNSDVAANLAAQQQYQKQGQSLVQDNINANTPQAAGQAIASGTSAAQNEYSKANAIPLTSSTGNSAVSNSGGQTGNIVGQDSKAQVGLNNAQAAPLQGYNDWQVGQWIKNLQTQTGLNQLQNFSQSRNSVLPLQLAGDRNSESGLMGLGSLLSTAGGLAGLFGATAAPAAGMNGGANAGVG